MSLPGRAHCRCGSCAGGDKQKIVNQLAVRRYRLRPHTGGPGLEIA
ncbi:hypothetical protein ACLB1N_32345 [Escherichia coli]